MKSQVKLNEEDFLQQFPNQDKFTDNEDSLPEWYELTGQAIPMGKPLNLADLQTKE